MERSEVIAGIRDGVANDDATGNRFAPPMRRFPQIEEDEPPLYYLI